MIRRIYHASPDSVKGLVRKIKPKIIPFPYIWGSDFAKTYKELLSSQWYSRAELEEIQCRRLEAIIKHAYEKVPYYRRLFDERGLKPDDIKSKEDLPNLPLLEKGDLVENAEDLKAADIETRLPKPTLTGGSTGEPVSLWLCRRTKLMEAACVWRHWNGFGIHFRDRKVALRAPQEYSPTYREKMETKVSKNVYGQDCREHPSTYYDGSNNTLYMSCYDMNESVLFDYTEQLLAYKPRFFRGTPSSMFILATFCRDHKVSGIKPMAIQVSSEMLYDFQRKRIEKQFNCRIFDWYGAGEKVAKAGECTEHAGYHICSEFGIIEVVRDGEVVSNGEQGELVVTTLVNYAMPLIRYRIGDLGTLDDRECACGRGLPLLKSLHGKIRDVIVTPNGKIVHGEFFKYVIEKPWILKGRCLQEALDRITIEFVPRGDIPNDEYDTMKRALRDHLGEEMAIQFKVVEAIEPTKAGKRHYIISKVSQERFGI